jgi:putative membrane protein
MRFQKIHILIFTIWLFHISGTIGILLGFQDWFAPLTPLNLGICIAAILIVEYENNKQQLPYFIIPFLIGFMAEWLGVNTGLIFGEYSYGNNLGIKFQGVPWMIGINWVILVYSTSAVAQKYFSNKILVAIVGAVIMVVLDIFMELCAPRFDFWLFRDGIVPIQNYIAWFIIAFMAHLLFNKYFVSKNDNLASHVLIVFFLFFMLFSLV